MKKSKKTNGYPNHSSLGLALHLFPFQVRPLILFISLLFSTVHFVKGLFPRLRWGMQDKKTLLM